MLKHVVFFSLGFGLLLSGCANQSQEQKRQDTLWAQNEQRMVSLEKNVTQLNEQVAILNNRVYEVRGYKGKKTGMTVVPVTPGIPTPAMTAAQTPKPAAGERSVAHNQAPQATPPNRPAQQQKRQQPKPKAKAQQPAAKPAVEPTSLPPALPPQTSAPTNAALPPQGAAAFALPPESGVANPPAMPPTLPMTESPKPEATPVPNPLPSSPKAAAQRAPSRAARNAQPGEEASYKEALALARSGRSQEGIQKFTDFLQKYPNGKYAPNASFWIGECYYSQGKYKEALDNYAQVNAKYPKHHKNADALLKSGMSYKKMGDSANAKASYSRLMQEFPRSEAAQRARSGR